jgi:hypothetical protein
MLIEEQVKLEQPTTSVVGSITGLLPKTKRIFLNYFYSYEFADREK